MRARLRQNLVSTKQTSVNRQLNSKTTAARQQVGQVVQHLVDGMLMARTKWALASWK